jgi:hypothetical protein
MRPLALALLLSACSGDDTTVDAAGAPPDAPVAIDAGADAGPAAAAYSIELSRTLWGIDYVVGVDLPPIREGLLFSAWTRVPDPGTAVSGDPASLWSRGNFNVLVLNAAAWNLIAIDGNCSVMEYDGAYGDEFGPPGTIRARYNANTMFGTLGTYWIGDYSYFESDFYQNGRTEDEVKGWVWVAWQVVLNADDSFTVRQWLKFGPDGAVLDASGPEAETITRAAVIARMKELGEPDATADAWTPDAAVATMYLGENNGYLWHARLEQRADEPTLVELEAIARLADADADAWAFYPLEWRDGAADLADRSGHGRDLSIRTDGEAIGTLYQGPAAPAL